MTRLTADRLFCAPALSGHTPTRVAFSPDGAWVTYLANAADDPARLDLYRYDLASGEHACLIDARRLETGTGAMSEQEKARQERMRFFARGITGYAWHPQGGQLLLAAEGTVFLADALANGDGARIRSLTPPGTRQSDARFSNTGRYVAYLRDGELYLHDLRDGLERRLTHDASETVSNGLADFIAQEEMHRFEGYWFSGDDRHIAYTRVDEGPVALTHRYEIEAERFSVHAQRYPFAGGANAEVTLLLVELESGRRREIPYREAQDDYLARVCFASGMLCAQVQSRDQRRLSLQGFDLESMARRELLRERQESWINLHDNLRFLPESTDFLWTSERDGHAHLYLYRDRPGGPEPIALTAGRGRVNRLCHVDARQVCFEGWFEDPVEQHGYRLELACPGRPQALTRQPGWHQLTFAPDGERFADHFSSFTQPPALHLCSLATGERRGLAPNRIEGDHPYLPYLEHHSIPELASTESEGGERLWYRLTKPPQFDPTRRYPVLVHVYGGPGVQRVRHEWAPLALQLFAQQGYVVFELDNRGTGNRDKAFESAIQGRLGHVEVADQCRGVDWLQAQPWVDPRRIGIFGHSYGGYMALMCLCRAPEVFRAGVAVAPVTDWHLYDTHYAERYLGTPEGNPSGYRDSAVTTHLEQLRGALLIMHGMADDNVLFTHSTKLFKALQDRHYRFQMMTYPGAKHALQERSVAIHRYLTILDFLDWQLRAA